jgi:hypothetical protein
MKYYCYIQVVYINTTGLRVVYKGVILAIKFFRAGIWFESESRIGSLEIWGSSYDGYLICGILWGGAAGSSETSVSTDQNKHCRISDDDGLDLLSWLKSFV